jgi:arsenate reductase
MLQTLQKTIDFLISQFSEIPDGRKIIIKELSDYIRLKQQQGEIISLNFICTHNSRRSHIAQIWAQTSAHVYRIKNVHAFSGGTEATAFNPNAVIAIRNVGFDVTVLKDGKNPVYAVSYDSDITPIKVFSKTYYDQSNPKKDFAAVMTCSEADENCPIVNGAEKRIKLTYADPKAFDNTPLQSQKYTERVNEIGRELLYAFSQSLTL